MKSTSRLLKNEAGAGILSVMLSLVALGGAATYVSGVLTNNQKAVQNNVKQESFRELVNMVKHNLYAGTNCTQALGRQSGSIPGVTLVNAFSALPLGDDVELPISVGMSSELLKAGWETAYGIKVKSVKLNVDTTPIRTNVRIHGEIPKTAAYATLIIEPEDNVINVLKRDIANKLQNDAYYIKLFVYYEDIAGVRTIHSCTEPASEAEFCTNAMKGAYNADPSITSDLRCQPDLNCFYYKNGLLPAGTTCPSPYTATVDPTGVPIRVGNSDMVSCSWCHPDAAATLAAAGGAYAVTGYGSANELDIDIEDDSGNPVTCSSSGYSGLNPQDSYQAYQDYNSQIGNISAADQAANSGCLSYVPPQPPCNATTLSNCSLGNVPHGSASGTCTNGTIGTCSYSCNIGQWQQSSNACAVPVGCGATSNGTCDLAAASHNGSAGTCASGMTGSCSASCYNGNWTVTSNSCVTPNPTTGGSGGGTTGGTSGGSTGGNGGGSGGGTGGCYQCFVADTRITMADGTEKNIQDVNLGDRVKTYDESTKKFVISPVTKVDHHEAALNILFTFTLANGRTLTSNDVHLIYVPSLDNYFSAQEIANMYESDPKLSLLGRDGKRVAILKVERSDKKVPLYNFHVRGKYDTKAKEVNLNHNYYADGVLVHNIKQNMACQ